VHTGVSQVSSRITIFLFCYFVILGIRYIYHIIDDEKTDLWYHALDSIPASGSPAWLLKLRAAGTLSNGFVFSTASELHGLGLFAGKNFYKGDIVTECGGDFRWWSDVPERSAYARVIPDTGFVREASQWQSKLKRFTLQEYNSLITLSAPERKRVVAPASSKIGTRGCGYLCNRSVMSSSNVQVRHRQFPGVASMLHPVSYFVAKRNIQKGEEILDHYNLAGICILCHIFP
jgi:hypothetical protein